MRVSTGTLHQTTLQHLRASQARLARLQSQIASGRRIERPSDDAAGTIQGMGARGALRARAQWSSNLVLARQHAQATETSLGAAADMVAEARLLATRADASQSAEAMAALARQVDGLLEGLLDEANRAQDGVRLFGGSDTRGAPVEALRDEAGRMTGVTAASRAPEGRLLRQVGEGTLLGVNTSAEEAFGPGLELFAHLVALRDALDAGDAAAAAELQPLLDRDLERVAVAQAVGGVLARRLDHLEERLAQEEMRLEAARSQFEDLDIAQAVMDYQEEQTVLEAALTLSGRLLELTLARYLQ